MKHWTRLIALVMAGLLTAACAGCSGGDKPGESKQGETGYEGKPEQKYLDAGKEIPYKDLNLEGREITIAAWWDPKPADKGSSTAAELGWERIEYLEGKYNCKFVFLPMVQAEMIARIQTSVEAGDPVFDVGYVAASTVPMLANKEYLQDLKGVECFDLSADKWAKFPQTVGVFGDKVYTFEMGSVFYPRQVMLWNKTMFEKNNWPNLYELVEKKEWTFEKMLEIAQLATDEASGRAGIVGYADLLQNQIILSNDAELISFDDNGVPHFAADSPNALESIQFLLDLDRKYKVMGEPEAPTWDYYTQAFKDGKVAMAFTELYMVGDIKDMKDNYGIVPPPMGPKATTYSSRVGDAPIQVMLANNPKLQEVGFILDLYSEPFPGEENNWRTGYEAFLRDDDSVNLVKKISDEYAQFDNAFFFPGARNLINTAINDVWYGEKTPAEAIGEIKTQAEKSIQDTYAGWTK